MTTARKLFLAGSTGAIGRTLLPIARAKKVDLVAQERPKHGHQSAPGLAVFELSDEAALTHALEDRTTVIQLIGTMRKRFSTGDTYESSDIATTRQLVEAARRAGTVDHFVLLSAVGAGSPFGAYLRAKAEAERLVRESGVPFTIFRPSAFDGAGHRAPPLMGALTNALGLSKYKPIRAETLAATILHVALERAPLGAVLEGDSLWSEVAKVH